MLICYLWWSWGKSEQLCHLLPLFLLSAKLHKSPSSSSSPIHPTIHPPLYPNLLQLSATITSLPPSHSTASLHLLSNVYATHGYEPKLGKKITQADLPLLIDDKDNRILYVRPSGADRWGSGGQGNGGGASVHSDSATLIADSDKFEFTVSDATATSLASAVTLISSTSTLVSSTFSKSTEGWTISGNTGSSASYEKSSRGGMNNYIFSTDDLLNIGIDPHQTRPTADMSDLSLWHFKAPSKFNGHLGAGYQGSLNFKLSSFSGDFSSGRLNEGLNLVEISCKTCSVNAGEKIVFPLSATSGFNGATSSFTLALSETSGWLIDPKNTLTTAWLAPTKCNMIEILSGITELKILGDYTKWYESVSLDDVKLKTKNGKSGGVPICGQGTPDGSSCTC